MTTAIITRPNAVIAKTTEIYTNAGLGVFAAPCFAIKTSDSVKPQWLELTADVWIVLSVHALEHALLIAPDLAPKKMTTVIAVGPAVEKVWSQHFEHAISSHPWMNSEGVIELLKVTKPKSVKIITTGDGRDLIKSHCMQQAISYTQINTYQRLPLDIDQAGLKALYHKVTDKPVVLTATSSGILTQFMSQLSAELKTKVLSQPLVVGAKRIGELAEEFGFVDVHLADSPSDSEMIKCVLRINKDFGQ